MRVAPPLISYKIGSVGWVGRHIPSVEEHADHLDLRIADAVSLLKGECDHNRDDRSGDDDGTR